VSKLKAIEQRFRAMFANQNLFSPSANVAVGDLAPVIANDDPTIIQHMQFGLTPVWAKKKMYLFNARAEGDQNKANDPHYRGGMGIISKPSFRSSIRSKRCLVLADGFIEGPMKEKLNEPNVIYRRDGQPFAMAGLWDEWTNKETGEVTRSYSIITTVANDLMKRIGHHRSPVILEKNTEETWLSEIALNQVVELLKPAVAEEYNAYPIANTIKSPRIKDLVLLHPIGDRIYPEYTYEIHQELKLEGMGMTTARKRKNREDNNDPQLSLF
jgi:putative SOS response-associated peptidase YedK